MKTELGLQNGDWDEFADGPLSLSRAGSASARNDMSFRTDSSSSFYEFDVDPSSSSLTESDEGRLSRALQSWMPDHVIKPLYPREKPPPEPVFSGKLGKECPDFKKTKTKEKNNKRGKVGDKRGKATSNEKRGKVNSEKKRGKVNADERRCKTAPALRRVPSNDSIVTSLSLLSCSTEETKQTVEVVQCVPRQRKRKVTSRASTRTSEDQQGSKWVELATKRSDILSRYSRNVALRTDIGLIGGQSEESEAFQLFDQDEQKAVYETGTWLGIKYINKQTLKRCDSAIGLCDMPPAQSPGKSKIKRVLSASATKGRGRPLDIAELKRERMNRLLAEEQARLQLERERRKGRRAALTRKISAASMTGSVAGSLSGSAHASPPTTAATSISAVSQSGQGSDIYNIASSDKDGSNPAEENISMWKGDREILEIDLKRELTQRVKHRISSTRSALKRATGLGDSNEQTLAVGKNDEFPKHVEEDFCYKPRIIQKMRISPHLSDVIHDDIQVRMGRPRYHEIRVTDVEQWNKGQALNRAHTNLKVFNWLHSLRESEFETDFEVTISDEIPDISVDLELLHVESADEPDVKPLYRAYEVRIL